MTIQDDVVRVHVPQKAQRLVLCAAEVFCEEIEKRTGLKTEMDRNMEVKEGVLFGVRGDVPDAALEGLEMPGVEGYRLSVETKLTVAEGADERGVFYAMGYLLRKALWRPGVVTLPDGLRVSRTPVSRLRGHQLGYRPKTNAYDAWTPEIYDQYLRELAIFGCNAVELLPPHTDDDLTGPLMKMDPLEMIGILSEKAHRYGMDVWVWYPDMGSDYESPEAVAAELTEREEVFRQMPYLDHVFIPGGDPGNLDPEALFRWTHTVADCLRAIHPNAGVWLSPQTFTPSRGWTDAFYAELEREPEWLTGVVFGPWEKDPPDVLRDHVPARYPIRNYPDIGHSLRCEYPVEKWDLALALTLGRECINPRPTDEKHIQNTYHASFIGSITYSEGINDDVNKFIWSDQEWSPETEAVETLRDYARLFIDPNQADDLAHGFLSLEENFRGPLAVHEGIETCLMQWQTMERRLCAWGRNNFRFEMGLLRAYFDAYQQQRLIYETYLENQAKYALRHARETGVAQAVKTALAVMDRARTEPVCADWHDRVTELADALFEHIGMQLTESRHQALHWGRGGFVECMDIPLNDARWWRHVLPPLVDAVRPKEILASANPSAPDDKADGGLDVDGDEGWRIAQIDHLLHRCDPGPGGSYTDLGGWSGWLRIENPTDYATDPAFLHGALTSFILMPPDESKDAYHLPLAWQRNGCAMYMTPLCVSYEGLETDTDYVLRCTYLGFFGQHARLEADDGTVIHDEICTDRQIVTLDFVLPRRCYANGHLGLRFTGHDGERGISVAELWLIKQPKRL